MEPPNTVGEGRLVQDDSALTSSASNSAQASSGSDALRRSPLYGEHAAAGAKLVPFGGWEMPLAYDEGTVAEHRACRNRAVMFDVSHLGTVTLVGSTTFDLLQRTLTNDLRKVEPGRAQYTHLLTDDGSVADDIIVWWLREDRFDVMPNASNTARVVDALGGEDTTTRRAIIAVQGPSARSLVSSVAPDAASVGRFRVTEFSWKGQPALAAGTGYTGEDGVECAIAADDAPLFWQALLEAGVPPAGLGARDTLRLEAGLPLHGHELGPGITPLQAGLGWVIGWQKETFVGRDALEEERQAGIRRRLRGLVGSERRPPRADDVIVSSPAGQGAGSSEQQVGRVTSGNFSPMLERGIALGFIDEAAELDDGEEVSIEVRGRPIAATLMHPPFWPPKGSS